MLTKNVVATLTVTSLKALMETAGHTFSNDNDKCTEILLQIDPSEADTFDVMSGGETSGITISNAGPSWIQFPVDRVRRVYLKGSAATVSVKVLVSQL